MPKLGAWKRFIMSAHQSQIWKLTLIAEGENAILYGNLVPL